MRDPIRIGIELLVDALAYRVARGALQLRMLRLGIHIVGFRDMRLGGVVGDDLLPSEIVSVADAVTP